jgi:hypothetical protein
VLGAAGLKKHLPVVTTARSRALDFGSVAAVAKNSFTVHTECTQAMARGGMRCVLGAAGLKKHLTADKAVG